MSNKRDTTAVSPEHARFLSSVKKADRRVTFFRYFILIAALILWELSARMGWIDPFIMSSPSQVMSTVARLYNGNELFHHIGITLYETVVGFILGTILGTLIAILLWWSKSLARILDPYLVVLNALPKIALGPILIVWFGAGVKSIIIMGLLISLVVTVMTVLAGFDEITGEKQLLMRTLGATKLQILTMVVLPASAHDHERPQDKRGHELGRRHSRRIPGFTGRARIFDRIRQPGVQAGLGHGQHSDTLRARRRHVLRGCLLRKAADTLARPCVRLYKSGIYYIMLRENKSLEHF